MSSKRWVSTMFTGKIEQTLALSAVAILAIGAIALASDRDRGKDKCPCISVTFLEGTTITAASGYSSYSCGCPWMTNPATGAVARIFAGGTAGEDAVLVEDAVTGDAYLWTGGSAWQRVGSSARTYAFSGTDVSSLFRLGGDGRLEKAESSADNWQRVSFPIGRALIGIPNAVLFVDADPSLGRAESLWRLSGSWTNLDNDPAATYVASGGDIYKKREAGDIWQYAGTPLNWTQIGAVGWVSIEAAAGGTVFAKDADGHVWQYAGMPYVWNDVGAGLDKTAGTTSTVYALVQGTIARLDGATWTPVRTDADAWDIVAGGAHLFAVTSAGSVLRLEDSGDWTDISCTGATSQAGCASRCDPAPSPSLTAPAYADAQKQIQDDPANAQYDVLTYHNDHARTGAALHENILTPSAVANGDFGLLGRVPLLDQDGNPTPGRIFGQPLYMEQAAVTCSDGLLRNANIAYVATLDNIVYAIDIDRQAVCWQTGPLGCPQPARAAGCYTPEGDIGDAVCNGNFDTGSGTPAGVRVGIAGTPVIDRAKDIMYLVARVRDGSDLRGRFFLHVLDTRTGQLVSRTEAVADTLNGHDDCNGHPFRPSLVTQRAALLLVDNKLLVAFAGNKGETDAVDYHGHVIAFDVADPAYPQTLNRAFCATPNRAGGGIWMAGGGMASDGTSAYFTTGNGAQRWQWFYQLPSRSCTTDADCPTNPYRTCDRAGTRRCGYFDMDESTVPNAPPAGNYPASFVKLRMDLSATGYTDVRQRSDFVAGSYAPQIPAGRTMFWVREKSDADFGSSGVLLLGSSRSCWPSCSKLIGGGKDGRLYYINPATMSRVQDFQAFVHKYDERATYDYGRWYAGPHIHGGPVVWERPNDAWVYAWAEKDHLKRFVFNWAFDRFNDAGGGQERDATPANPFPTARGDLASSAPLAMPGGMLSLSANGQSGGIIWATIQEPYKFCTRVGPAVEVDRPASAGEDVPGCNTLGGYVPGRLFAFDATPDSLNRLRLLWGETNQFAPNNFIPAYAKNAPPTVAHGKILVATANGELRIYGLGSGQRSRRPIPTDGIALTGVSGWHTIPLAVSNGNGSFAVTNAEVGTDWGTWAATPQVAKLRGDFNGDGFADLLLVGVPGWTLFKVAFSNHDPGGTFNIVQGGSTSGISAPTFFSWSTSAGAKPLVGDFDGDGQADVALTGRETWPGSPNHSVPVAFSNGNGSFRITNEEIRSDPPYTDFAYWSTSPAAAALVGDFDGDGRADIALTGEGSWHTIPVAFSNGNGTFRVTNKDAPAFALWASGPNVKKLVGDFNGDGRADIALTGYGGWYTIPVAFSRGEGSFTVTNCPASDAMGMPCSAGGSPIPVNTFADWASRPGATLLVGDFNGDGRDDIALLGSPTFDGVIIAFSNGDGTFRITKDTSSAARTFAGWAAIAGATLIVGDFDRDGFADIAITGVSGFVTVPVALSNGDGTFRVFNDGSAPGIGAFAGWASAAGPTRIFPGKYR